MIVVVKITGVDKGNLFVSPKGLVLDGDEQSEVEVKDESKKISPA